MYKILSFFLCAIWASFCSAISVSISEKAITIEEAEKLGFHRLVNGESDSWDDSWIIIIYPEVDLNGHKSSEVCLDIYENSEKLASSCTVMISSEIKGFNRSDIEVSKQRAVSVDVSITYGGVRYLIKNVVSLPGKDYESFKKRYNK
ncbi:hypothetical protein Q3O59_06950 [Alkalimonas delamerensis]|uniref:Uncharacterized protein n=1 Tax=Alkalimonas delamerensis TaxID=265981 RepID=A0ABT9GP75_9GAMM|nr:hypothetical protein [Alkalimonas delamerensis]MDP4528769.1 hypothetical protein [Alkalimonas delamerensis]